MTNDQLETCKVPKTDYNLNDILNKIPADYLLPDEKEYIMGLIMKDELTGAWNRRAMTENLEQVAAKQCRDKRPWSLAVYDIDRFKLYNDTFGHKMGDFVLKQVAEITEKALREEDIQFRYGGEEFVILYRDTGIHEAYAGAERVRGAVELQSTILYHKGVIPQPVTISIGVATAEYKMLWGSVLGHADQALYVAKKNGRNRVETYEKPD